MNYKVGDIVDECPSCDGGKVIFSETDDGICDKCAAVFELSADETAPAPPPPPPPPPPLPKPVASKPVVASSVQPPTKVPPTPPLPKPVVVPQMKSAPVVQQKVEEEQQVAESGDSKELGIADHIFRSRPWKWAYELKKSGNPYREGAKNFKIFNIFDMPCTVEQAILKCVALGYNDKLSYLLTVYEVVYQNLSAGLLVIDETTGMISQCKNPVPYKVK